MGLTGSTGFQCIRYDLIVAVAGKLSQRLNERNISHDCRRFKDVQTNRRGGERSLNVGQRHDWVYSRQSPDRFRTNIFVGIIGANCQGRSNIWSV